VIKSLDPVSTSDELRVISISDEITSSNFDRSCLCGVRGKGKCGAVYADRE
jgi:hypothetical protein